MPEQIICNNSHPGTLEISILIHIVTMYNRPLNMQIFFNKYPYSWEYADVEGWLYVLIYTILLETLII